MLSSAAVILLRQRANLLSVAASIGPVCWHADGVRMPRGMRYSHGGLFSALLLGSRCTVGARPSLLRYPSGFGCPSPAGFASSCRASAGRENWEEETAEELDEFEVPKNNQWDEEEEQRGSGGMRNLLGLGGRTSLEQQRYIKDQKILRQEKRLLERKKRDPIPIVIPSICTPRTLSHVLAIRAIDILKQMIKLGLDPQNTHEIIDPEVVDIICQDQWYTPVRLALDAGSTVPSKLAAYLEARKAPLFQEERKKWSTMASTERAALQSQAEQAAKKKLAARFSWSKGRQLEERAAASQYDGSDESEGDRNEDEDEEDASDEELEVAVEEPQEGRLFDHALLRSRAPVVAVMGHVNHGKTTLLDRLHGTSKVAAQEAGGITQHVRAFQTQFGEYQITFLDTPGHAAFSGIRKRGADVTDIVLLIVAVDSGVKPQTIESAKFALERDLPIIVVLNKCDRDVSPEDISNIGSQLADIGINIDEVGGSIPSVRISALKGKGLEDLQDMILMQAEDLQLEAEVVSMAEGTVIEAVPSTKGLGIETTALVQWGTLSVGDPIVAGRTAGKVKLLFDVSTGQSIRTARPSQPVRVIGLKESPLPGDSLQVLSDEKATKAVATARERYMRKQQNQEDQKLLAQNLKLIYSSPDQGATPQQDIDPENRNGATHSGLTGVVLQSGSSQQIETELVVVVKTDVFSSFEAIQAAVKEQMAADDQLSIRFIHSGPGQASEMDVEIAHQAQTAIICFRSRPTPRAAKEADLKKVPVHHFNVIYDATAEIRRQAEAKLLPHIDAQITGDIQVLKSFSITHRGSSIPVAGGRVVKGEIARNQIMRLSRAGRILAEGPVHSLKFFKEDIAVVKKGSECGVKIEGWEDYQVGDLMQSIKYIKTHRQFGEPRRNDYKEVVQIFQEERSRLDAEIQAAIPEPVAKEPTPSETRSSTSSPFSGKHKNQSNNNNNKKKSNNNNNRR